MSTAVAEDLPPEVVSILLVDPDGKNAVVDCDADNNCIVRVRAQIALDKSDLKQVVAALLFKSGARNYWNNQSVSGPNGETITFDVDFNLVEHRNADPLLDTLVVFSGSGKSKVDMSLNIGGQESPPDFGEIYTDDPNNRTSTGGMPGIGAHETGHLMGMRDLYEPGEVVPYNPSPDASIMRYSQLTNSAAYASWVLTRYNGNTVVNRQTP